MLTSRSGTKPTLAHTNLIVIVAANDNGKSPLPPAQTEKAVA